MFVLDAKLKDDTFFVADLKICQLLLMNNANYPWFILVPREQGAVEITALPFEVQTDILREINFVAEILQKKFSPYKINIGALGNVVRQLHIHVIARFENDPAFPKPVWGEASKPYSENAAQDLISEIQELLK